MHNCVHISKRVLKLGVIIVQSCVASLLYVFRLYMYTPSVKVKWTKFIEIAIQRTASRTTVLCLNKQQQHGWVISEWYCWLTKSLPAKALTGHW